MCGLVVFFIALMLWLIAAYGIYRCDEEEKQNNERK